MERMADPEYVRRLYEWRAQLDADLRRDYGWLTALGLTWLKDGVNTLGSSPDCDVRLPRNAARLLGVIDLNGGTATLKADVGQSVDVNGFAVRAPTPLHAEGESTAASMVAAGDLRMLLVRQGNRMGLRVWDNALSRDVPPRTWYEVDDKYRVRASYAPYPVPVKVEIPNSQGKIEIGYVQGAVSFKLGGKSFSLDAAELENGTLYVPFRDWTNGLKTYPRGRYLYTEQVAEDGACVIDFNRAYNPPCAFKESEACSFAPIRNELKLPVEAGELFPAHR